MTAVTCLPPPPNLGMLWALPGGRVMAYARSLLTVLSLGVAATTVADASLRGPQPVEPAGGEPRTEWRYFGGDKAFTRYSPLAQITRDNVRGLRIAWRRPAVNSRMLAAFP